MFVSSYSTYISTNSSQRAEKERVDSTKTKSTSFENKFSALNSAATKSIAVAQHNLPVNYVSNYKVMNNQQKLHEQTQQTAQKEKFTKLSGMSSAKIAYKENSTMFSFLIKPKTTLDQTPALDKTLPSKAQETQEKSLRHAMINTYVTNENYYRITA